MSLSTEMQEKVIAAYEENPQAAERWFAFHSGNPALRSTKEIISSLQTAKVRLAKQK